MEFSHSKNSIFKEQLNTLIKRTKKTNLSSITTFFDLEELKNAISHLNKQKANYQVFDNNELFERKIIAILPPNQEEHDFNEVKCIKITPNKKDYLTHRDYTGALYNSGININLFGDIIIKDDCAYVFIVGDMIEYILYNIDKIGNTYVSLEEANYKEITFSKEFTEVTITTSSKRIDIILAHSYKLSRAVVDKKISKKELNINSVLVTSKTKEAKENDIISFRGYGKFIIGESSLNRKNKHVITIKKYS